LSSNEIRNALDEIRLTEKSPYKFWPGRPARSLRSLDRPISPRLPDLLGRHHAAHRYHPRHRRPRPSGLLGRYVMTTRISGPPLSLDAVPYPSLLTESTDRLCHRRTGRASRQSKPWQIASSPTIAPRRLRRYLSQRLRRPPRRPVNARIRETVRKQSP
jgi:hypothetical protein